jgi:hypothetical protein
MKTDSRIEKWFRWLEVIQGEIYELLMLRYVFGETQKIIKANPKIQIDGYFYEWLAIAYSKTASVGVRRQLDCDSSVITLGRLLSEIQQSPTLLTLERFEGMYTHGQSNRTKKQRMLYELQRRQAQKDFKQFSGKLMKHVNPALVCKDLILLSLVVEPIRKYVNKRVAHRDRKQFSSIPTFPDLDKAIDSMFNTFKKYMLLLKAVQYDITIQPQWDWKDIFKTAWIENH